MTHKSDISTLPSASMTFSTTTGRPHALQTLNTGSATRTFTYDANGRMTGGQVASGTRTLTYTSYDLLASAAITGSTRSFNYGPDRQRYRQVSGARTYTYIGEHYVKEVQSGNPDEHKLYIFANGSPVAYVSDDASPETRYFHKDLLGSITTIITNQNFAGREKLSYDAWGKRRHGTDWWSAAAAATEERGYTGHEHLDDMALIHMNGRAYDPLLARFTSPDPFVPAPLYSQSYNRYAYVYANPLRYTDPSGFNPFDGCFVIACYRPGQGLHWIWNDGGRGNYDGRGFTTTVVSNGTPGTAPSASTSTSPSTSPSTSRPHHPGGPGIDRNRAGLPGVSIVWGGMGFSYGSFGDPYGPAPDALMQEFGPLMFPPDPAQLQPAHDLTATVTRGDSNPSDSDLFAARPIAQAFVDFNLAQAATFKNAAWELLDGFLHPPPMSLVQRWPIDNRPPPFKVPDSLAGQAGAIQASLALVALPISAGKSQVATAPLRVAPAARGIELGGVPGIFTMERNAVGGEVWTSTGLISQKQFRPILESAVARGDSVTLVSGAHGTPLGMIRYPDRPMFNADVTAFGAMPRVTIYDITKMGADEFGALLQGNGTTIVGICYSGAVCARF